MRVGARAMTGGGEITGGTSHTAIHGFPKWISATVGGLVNGGVDTEASDDASDTSAR